MQNNARTSRKITNASLSRQCYGHDMINFNEIMPRIRNIAALISRNQVFDGYRLQEAKNNNEEESKDDTTINDFAAQWSSIVFDALCFEAERCLPKALLDPTPKNSSDEEGPSDFDSNLIEMTRSSILDKILHRCDR